MKRVRRTLVLASFAAILPLGALAHDHLAAGVSDLNLNGQADPGEPLQLIGASISGTTNSATYHLVPRAQGANYGGYYSLDEFAPFNSDYFTFVSWSDGQTQIDGPELTPTGMAYHAPTGTDVWMEIASVSGPPGAHFGFWEAGASNFQTVPTKSFLTGASTGGYTFELSEPLPPEYNVPPEEQDPYGHIHNRGWTADQPGTYTVGFRLRDQSGLGPGSGPLAAASGIYNFTFIAVAVPEPGSAALLLAGLIPLALRRRR